MLTPSFQLCSVQTASSLQSSLRACLKNAPDYTKGKRHFTSDTFIPSCSHTIQNINIVLLTILYDV